MEEKLKERLEQLGSQILITSRNGIYLSMRFFEPALFRFSYELSLSTQMLGTDGEKFYYNPKYLLELYDKSPVAVNRAYLHTLLHCLFRHLFKDKLQKSGEDEAYKQDYSNWDLACDIAIESVIDSLEEVSCVLVEVSAYREEIYRRLKSKLSVLTAEGIYLELGTKVFQEEYEQLKREFQVDDHNFWEAQQKDGKNEKQKKNQKEQNQKLKIIWEKIAKKTQTAMETYYRQAGDCAGNLSAMLKIKNRQTYDYKQFLQQFVVEKEEICLDLDSFDYIPYCFGLSGYGKDREIQIPLIEPLEYKEHYGIDEFAIAIDTSGSVSKEQVEEFLAETIQVLQSEKTFFRKVTICILQCDAKLQKKFMIRSKEDWQLFMDRNIIEVSGFGGTDFRPVFSYLEELLEKGEFTRLRGLLYFTDGFGIYPEQVPSFETAFILPADKWTEPPVPPWAIKLFLNFYKNKK